MAEFRQGIPEINAVVGEAGIGLQLHGVIGIQNRHQVPPCQVSPAYLFQVVGGIFPAAADS